MSIFDFSGLIISNGDYTSNTISDTVSRLYDFDVRKVLYTFDADLSGKSIALNFSDKIAFDRLINTFKCRGMLIATSFNILTDNGILQTTNLSKLSIKSSGYLPVTLPLAGAQAWFDRDINYLLYKQKLKPLFLNFGKAVITYPNNFIEHITDVPGAVFSFDVMSVFNKDFDRIIHRILSKNGYIVFELAEPIYNYTKFDTIFADYKVLFDRNDYTKLIISSSKAIKNLLY